MIRAGLVPSFRVVGIAWLSAMAALPDIAGAQGLMRSLYEMFYPKSWSCGDATITDHGPLSAYNRISVEIADADLSVDGDYVYSLCNLPHENLVFGLAVQVSEGQAESRDTVQSVKGAVGTINVALSFGFVEGLEHQDSRGTAPRLWRWSRLCWKNACAIGIVSPDRRVRLKRRLQTEEKQSSAGEVTMDRRRFCRSAVALGVGAAFSGCERQPPEAADAGTSLPAISLDGAQIELERAAVRELGESLSGPVILAGDPQYDLARRIWNGMHDKRPALIARCLDADDAALAVSFARDNNLLLAVRGGGHSWPGNSVCDGGLMLDLSRMSSVTVDADARRARAGGGALLNGLDTSTLEHGLVTTAGVVSHTGIGGFTLGGGYGRLNRSYGLAIDNVVGATIVTADGRIRRVDADNEPDLFWAIRGGGGNFGVVTELEYALYPFDRNVLSGNVVWPIGAARDVLEHYAEHASGYSDALYVAPTLANLPDLGDVIVMEAVYNGDPSEGEKELAELRAIGRPLVDGITVQDYMVMQTGEDAAFAPGIRSYAKNGMVSEWSQGLVDTLLDAFNPRLFLGSHVAGGAVGRVGETETAFPHRNAEIMLVFVSGWMDPALDEQMIADTRALYAAAESYLGGYYDNIEFDRDAARSNYGPAYPRLSRIKADYDPGNLFRLNSNIEPAA